MVRGVTMREIISGRLTFCDAPVMWLALKTTRTQEFVDWSLAKSVKKRILCLRHNSRHFTPTRAVHLYKVTHELISCDELRNNGVCASFQIL